MYPVNLIILIHGTFAHDAPWIQPNSFFSQQLQKKLGRDDKILKFNWSGKNSYNGRIEAGKELNLFLKLKQAEFQSNEIILIGHSHGGNVIFYALKDLPEDFAAIKVVTLATPFLISNLKTDKYSLKILSVLQTIVLPWAIYLIGCMIITIPLLAFIFIEYEKFKPLIFLWLVIPYVFFKGYELIIEGPYFLRQR